MKKNLLQLCIIRLKMCPAYETDMFWIKTGANSYLLYTLFLYEGGMMQSIEWMAGRYLLNICLLFSEFDACGSDPCQNGATCTNILSSYNCSCPPGYEGMDCETGMYKCKQSK